MPQIKPLLRPPTIAIIILAAALILNFSFPIRRIFPFPFNYTGILVIFLGALIAVWGRLVFSKHNIEIIPGSKSIKLAEEGPFIFSRNPMYVGLVTLELGIAVLLGSLVALLAPLLLFLYLNFFMIPIEEALMERTFREDYEDYKGRVRRWF